MSYRLKSKKGKEDVTYKAPKDNYTTRRKVGVTREMRETGKLAVYITDSLPKWEAG